MSWPSKVVSQRTINVLGISEQIVNVLGILERMVNVLGISERMVAVLGKISDQKVKDLRNTRA